MKRMNGWLLAVLLAIPLAACDSDTSQNTPDGVAADTANPGDTAEPTDTPAPMDNISGPDTPVPADTATETDTPSPDDTAAPATDRFANFNAGLARGYVDYAEERLPAIGSALAALDADVVCLQEVWLESDVQSILAATQTAFPYNYWQLTHAEGGEIACTPEEANPLRTCVETFCADVDPGQLTGCVLPNCGPEFNALSNACQGCLAANLGKPIAEIFAACAEGTGSSMSYDGANGVLLLSRFPLETTEILMMDSFLIQRVVLHARVTTPALGLTDVFCTHLAANLDEPAYNGDYGSYAGEQAHQIGQMTDWIAAVAGTNPVVALGDMNNGPDLGDGIAGELIENYQLFLDAGLSDPFVALEPPQCSWCGGDNPLIRDAYVWVLDHIFVKGLPDGVNTDADRVLDQPLDLTVNGAPVTTRLSDHYGVRVMLQR